MLPVQVHGLSPDLVSTFKIFRQAAAFEIIAEHREQLKAINAEIQRLVKRTGAKENSIHSQMLGEKKQLERTIEVIFESFKD